MLFMSNPPAQPEHRHRLWKRLQRVAATFGACWVLHAGATKVAEWAIGAPLHTRFTRHQAVHIANRLVSSVHGATVASLAAYSILARGDFERDTVHAYPRLADDIFALMAGYQCYDFAAEWLGGKTARDIWIHHSVVIIGVSLEMLLRQAAFYPLAFTMTEFTVLPYNVDFWMRTFGLAERFPTLYTLNLAVRVLMFWALRMFMGPWVFWQGFKRGQLRRLWTERKHFLVPFFVAFNVLTLSALNAKWTLTLTRKFLQHLRARRAMVLA